MVQKDGFVTLEQEPVLDFTNRCFLDLSLFILLSDRLIQVLVLGLWGLCWSYNCGQLLLLLVILFGNLDLLNDLLILEIDLIHLLRHFKLILWKHFSPLHTFFDVTLDLFFDKEFVFKDFFPWDSFFRLKSQHFLYQVLKFFVFKSLGKFDSLLIDFWDKLLKRGGFMRSSSV